MNAQTKIEPPPLAKLREPFPSHHISKLPKPTKAQTDAVRADYKKGIRCKECGAWHHPDVVHLDYVGHAAATDRLLDTDLSWSWEPIAFGPDGLPVLDRNGGLWIRLTVCGVTRLGYGDADGKTGGNAIKEAIGDAIRNAGMRFGMALDLWHKGDLHLDDASEVDGPAIINDAQWSEIVALIESTGADTKAFCKHFKVDSVRELRVTDFAAAKAMLTKKLAKAAKPEPAETFGELVDDEIPY